MLPVVANISTNNFNRIYNTEVYITWDNILVILNLEKYIDGKFGYNSTDLHFWLFSFCLSFSQTLVQYDDVMMSNIQYLEPEI